MLSQLELELSRSEHIPPALHVRLNWELQEQYDLHLLYVFVDDLYLRTLH